MRQRRGLGRKASMQGRQEFNRQLAGLVILDDGQL
jgi:hypothetical protein